MKLGLLGPEGTFSEMAAKKWSPGAKLIFMDDMECVARAVDDGSCAESIVPIENSVEGTVGVVMDAQLEISSPIVGEEILPIRQRSRQDREGITPSRIPWEYTINSSGSSPSPPAYRLFSPIQLPCSSALPQSADDPR
ncbi:MAG TPA: prephenate dehydratase domain-containing protein [Methanocella sp.]|uniref:prephenate dehydratase domain-containing protein n=1 Tax=Methanocella sp. TaxID=2052833 RepID=UPI002C9D079B|nr:prephenate dehydratase domain-containing protein [Methanocella sp.]HTY91335.1 prephenate dehydratase domain-containing protein [Methanocella sp.]